MTTTTAVGYVPMRIAKVVGLATPEDEPFFYVVLEELSGDRQLAILIAQSEAFSLAARLGGIEWQRPMTYQLVAALVQAPWRPGPSSADRAGSGGNLHRHRGSRRPAWRRGSRRAAQRCAQPCGAGAGTDLRRARSAARGRGQTPG
jgi:hypothetical protein